MMMLVAMAPMPTGIVLAGDAIAIDFFEEDRIAHKAHTFE